MKRGDLMKRLRAAARAQGEELQTSEGANHTKVSIGSRHSVVPRHTEINEWTAKAILDQMGAK